MLLIFLCHIDQNFLLIETDHSDPEDEKENCQRAHSPTGQSLLTPVLTITFPSHVTAHTRPDRPAHTDVTSLSGGVAMCVQWHPSGHEPSTPSRTITRPRAVTAHTMRRSGSSPGTSPPPTLTSMKGSSVASWWMGGTADHVSRAT